MFGLFKKKQDWNAEVNPGGQQITVKAGENLLKSALAAGLPWPHDCRVGSCGSCRCTLRKGKVKELSDFAYVLDQEQLQSGMILACQSALNSDVVVEVEFSDTPAVEISSHRSLIHSLRPLTHDIVELVLKTDDDMPRTALAGQYAELTTSDISTPRSYSFARSPQGEGEGEVTFYIRKVPGGQFTEWLFAGDRTGTEVTFSGPYGSFWLREGDQPIVCIAGGSGMAPVKALLESALDQRCQRDVLFLFGARTRKDLYCLDEMAELQQNWNGNCQFVPVLSEEPGDSDWTGARGMVTDYLQTAYIDTGKVDIAASHGYLCGPPGMVDAATNMLIASGMMAENVYFDKFLDASSMPNGRE